MKRAPIALLAALLLAGCAGTEPVAEAPREAPADTTWQHIRVEASPQGAAAAFLWQPDEALGLTGRANAVLADPTRSVNPDNITMWALLFFTAIGDSLALEGGLIEGKHLEWVQPGGEATWVRSSMTPQVVPLGEAAEGAPPGVKYGITFGPGDDDTRHVGQTTGPLRNDTARIVVLAAAGDPGAVLDLSFRPTSAPINRGADATWPARPSEMPTQEPPRLGVTEGFEAAFFARVASFGETVWWASGDGEPWQATGPVLPASDAADAVYAETLEVTREARTGWTYLALREDVGTGVAETELRGHALGVEGNATKRSGTFVSGACIVHPDCGFVHRHDATLTAEGTGQLDWRIQRTSTAGPALSSGHVRFVYLWIGGGLEPLSGTPGMSGFFEWAEW